MLLAIETGNTNVKFALVDGLEVKARWRIATDARKTADEYAVWLDQLLKLEGYTRADVDAVAISTVVPRALHNLSMLARKYFDTEPLVAGRAPLDWRIKLNVDEPQNLGADRALNAISAQHLVGDSDKIIISFGTATTVDHVGADGTYHGGVIAPGINLSLDALVNATAQLPRIAIAAPEQEDVIGRTTESQMLYGIYWGYVSMIEGLIARMKKQIGRSVKVIATGGLAPLFQRHEHLFDYIESDLTLRGLALLYQGRKVAK
ncbi:MAG: type III pantothenate kinase [Sphingorhabdus sp.]